MIWPWGTSLGVAAPVPWDDGITSYVEAVSVATDLPFSFQLAIDHIRLADRDAEETMVRLYASAAVAHFEQFTNSSLWQRRWRQSLSGWPPTYVELAKSPVVQINAITYLDAGGTSQEWAGTPALYQITRTRKARLTPISGESFPAIGSGYQDPIQIEYTTGYEDSANIPPDIIVGVLMTAGELYKQRSTSVQGASVAPAILSAERLWQPYREFR